MLARMADSMHNGDALVGIEVAHPGINRPNHYAHEVPMALTALPVRTYTHDPVSARSMTKRDIATCDNGIDRHFAERVRLATIRFTSPYVMVKQLTSGVLDLIGRARPSIADPWLPEKIDEGRNVDTMLFWRKHQIHSAARSVESQPHQDSVPGHEYAITGLGKSVRWPM